jgi:hypothetical protein
MKKGLILLMIIFAFTLFAYEGIASREFNVPLNWVLGPDGTSVDADNDGIIDTALNPSAWQLANFTEAYREEYAATGFDRENLTLYLGDDDDNNASLIRAGNLSSLDTLSNYIRTGGFNLGNVSNNTLVKGDNVTLALWNVSGSDKNIYPRNIESNVGINITNPTMTLHSVGTFNASTGAADKNTSIIVDNEGNVIIKLG